MMNSMQSAGSLHYSTVGVTESRRFEYWNDVVLRHCIPAASAPLAGVDFDAQLTVRGVGLVDMCSLSAPLHSWDRTARFLRQGPDDDLWLGYMQDGYGQLEQGGRKATLAADSLVLYDAAQTFRFSLGGRDNHLVRIPRHLLTGGRTPHRDGARRPPPGRDPIARNAASGGSDARLSEHSGYLRPLLPDVAGSTGTEPGVTGPEQRWC